LQKGEIRSNSEELPLPPTLFNLRAWASTFLGPKILHQATRSSGKDYPDSLVSNSASSSERK
jgi:hypothetical protein